MATTKLFPQFKNIPTNDESPDKVMFRPTPLGGHIRLVQYERYLSNRLRLYGPFDRFIDLSKLLIPLNLNDLYLQNRYAISLKSVVMGVVEEERLDFRDFIYPDKGMECA